MARGPGRNFEMTVHISEKAGDASRLHVVDMSDRVTSHKVLQDFLHPLSRFKLEDNSVELVINFAGVPMR